jgi:hypothetical protein
MCKEIIRQIRQRERERERTLGSRSRVMNISFFAHAKESRGLIIKKEVGSEANVCGD